MLRSTTSRVLALVFLAVPAFAALSATPAQAASGDVLSMEWQTVSGRTPVVSQDATFTAITSGKFAGGAHVAMPGSFNAVWMAPPTGGQFEAGQTYSAAYTRTADQATLSFNNFAFSRTECSTTSTAPYAGTIVVQSASYAEDGSLVDLSADFSATCTPPTGAAETVAGSVRHSSTTPWLTVRPTSPKDYVATGRERTTTVTLGGVGADKTVQLGSATITGIRAADYQIAADGCAGATLGSSSTCTIDVTFAPQASSSAEPDRVARLSVPASGHVLTAVEVRLNSRAVAPPGAPSVKVFPTPSGVGVMWAQRSDTADTFRVERRPTGSDTWTTVHESAASAPLRYIDQDTAPGGSASYRVTGAHYGWDGTPTTADGTRPPDVPQVGPSSAVSYGDDDPGTSWKTISSGTASRFSTYGGLEPSLVADGPAGSGMSLDWDLPLVPGPGEYTAPEVAGQASLGSQVCPGAERVLEVRSVLYDETAKPVVFDGSWVERCSRTSPVRRMEVRIGTDGVGARVTTTPTVVRLTGFGDLTATTDVELGNGGPGAVTFGTPRIDGTGAEDWSVQSNTCTAAVQAASTCTLTVRLATTTEGPRPATLTIPRSDSVGALAPAYVMLEGTGGSTPGAVPQGSTLSTVGAVLVWWDAADGHGLEVDDYVVERQRVGTSSWEAVTNTNGSRRYVDRAVSDGASYQYRVTARNRIGYGPPTVIGATASSDAERALVVTGSTLSTGRTGLYQVDPDRPDAPPVPLTTDTRDYFSPAVSPAGSRLAFTRSTTDGSDGQYDLWSGTPANPAGRRLTAMAGVEAEATYSPNATRIAFTHYDHLGTTSVWVVDALGGTATRLRGDASAPAWTSDGRSLIVQDNTSVSAPLLTIAVATTVAQPVPGTDEGYEPAVSRTGRLAWINGEGQVLTLDPGATTPDVAVPAPTDSFITGLAYDDLGTLYFDTIDEETFEPVNDRSNHLAYAADPAPLRNDQTAPDLTVSTPGAYVRGAVSFTVSAADHGETPASALQPQCQLDGATTSSCSGSVALTKLTEGSHTLSVRVSDESGHTTTVERRFVSDTVAPKVALTVPSQATVSKGSAAFTWSGTDASGIAAHEVRVSTSTPWSSPSAYVVPAGLGSTTTSRSLTTRPALGQTVCVRVRALDRSGLWSAPTTRCVTRPLDDRSLRASAGWKRTALASGLQGTVTTVARKGATLTTTATATGRRIGVQAVFCGTCGAVNVYIGGTHVGLVSFRGANATRLVYLPVRAAPLRGVVTLRTTSRRTVRIDGLLITRS